MNSELEAGGIFFCSFLFHQQTCRLAESGVAVCVHADRVLRATCEIETCASAGEIHLDFPLMGL